MAAMAEMMLLFYCFVILMCTSTLAQNVSCTFGEETFQPGESLGDAFVTRCGSPEEYPCFCNPDIEGQAECPYCGFSAGDGSLYCASDGETIQFQDGSIVRVCSCGIPDDPLDPPIRECEVEMGCTGCEFPNELGELVCFPDGESFGDLIEGACGGADEWPSYCRMPPGAVDFVIDYPYCVFSDTESGDVLCATNEEEVVYTNAEGIEVNCTCFYTEEEGQQPNCGDGGDGGSPSDSPDNAPTDDAPSDEPPTDKPPSEDPPTEDPPSENPSEDPPTEDPPSEDPPTEDPPSEDPPTEDPPTQGVPTRAPNPPEGSSSGLLPSFYLSGLATFLTWKFS